MTTMTGPVLEGIVLDPADVTRPVPPVHDYFAHQRPHPASADLDLPWSLGRMLRNDFGVRWWLYTAAAGVTLAFAAPTWVFLAGVPAVVCVIGDWWSPRARAWLHDGPMHHTRG